MAPLVPCLGCRRHVRATDASCPFCGRGLADLPAPPPFDPARLRGIGRAAIVAFSTTMALAASGCDSASPTDGGVVDSGELDAGPVGVDAAYGGPPAEDAGPVGVDAAYGGPPADGGP